MTAGRPTKAGARTKASQMLYDNGRKHGDFLAVPMTMAENVVISSHSDRWPRHKVFGSRRP